MVRQVEHPPVTFPPSEWTRVEDGLPEHGTWSRFTEYWVQLDNAKIVGPLLFVCQAEVDARNAELGRRYYDGPQWEGNGGTLQSAVIAYAPYHTPEPPRGE